MYTYMYVFEMGYGRNPFSALEWMQTHLSWNFDFLLHVQYM